MTGTPSNDSQVTLRCIIIGILLCPCNAFWVIAMEQIYSSGNPTTMSLFFNAVFTLIVLLGFNAVLVRFLPRYAFGRMELLTMYTMAALGSCLASQDWIQVALPMWAYPAWFASPENKWKELFVDQLPRALVVTDKKALEGFWQGHSSIYRSHMLRAWAQPVFYWCTCFTAVQFVMLGLNILLRRQWTEHEKLSFPIMRLPLEITQRGNPLFKSPWFWWPFAFAVFLDIWNGLSVLKPIVPLIRVKVQDILPFFAGSRGAGAMGWTPISFYPCVIGIGLLLPTDLLFSCWFFYLLFKAELYISGLFGLEVHMGWDGNAGTFPYVVEQGMGGYLALAAMALYSARRHLKFVALHTWSGRDSEAREYRFAWLLLFFSLVYLLWFAQFAGFSFWYGALFLLLFCAIIIAIGKMRAELGPPVHDLHFGGPDRMLVDWFGTRELGQQNLQGCTLFFGFNRAYRGIPGPYQLELLKMGDLCGANRTGLLVALLIAAPLASVASCWAMLHWHYALGRTSPHLPGGGWVNYARYLQNPAPTEWGATAAMAVGSAIVFALYQIRFHILGWPFHPLGFAIAANWSMNTVWTPLLIAWIIKVLMSRYVGRSVHRDLTCIAIGLILGEFTIGSLWSIYGMIAERPTYAFWLF